jgi:uncharacterized membrane protein
MIPTRLSPAAIFALLVGSMLAFACTRGVPQIGTTIFALGINVSIGFAISKEEISSTGRADNEDWQSSQISDQAAVKGLEVALNH